MDQAKNVKKIIPPINPNTFSVITNRNFFTALIQLLLVFYASGIAPSLPPAALNFLSSTISRIVIYSIVLILAAYQPVTAIFASICVVVTMQTIQKMNMEEKLMSIVKYKDQNKSRENCMCFCSDEELNEALEKHLEKKRKEQIINPDIEMIHSTNNNVIQENNTHSISHEFEHEIPVGVNNNDPLKLHNNTHNFENSQEELYRKINQNDGTNKKQVSFSDHIFEEHLFNSPSPMITSENGPKAFNSDGHKYMDVDNESLHSKNDKTSDVFSLTNRNNTILQESNQNNSFPTMENHMFPTMENNMFPAMENHMFPTMENHMFSTMENNHETIENHNTNIKQENIQSNILDNVHANIHNNMNANIHSNIQENIQESIQNNKINVNKNIFPHTPQNMNSNINFSDLDFNDKSFHDGHQNIHQNIHDVNVKHNTNNVKSLNNNEILDKLSDDITGYISNDTFAIF